jgi:hypothetical protein
MAQELAALGVKRECRRQRRSAMERTACRLMMGMGLLALVLSGCSSPPARSEPPTATPMPSGRVDVGGHSQFYTCRGLGSREAVLEHLQPLKPLLFEMELEDWSRNPSDWPEERTGEVFDVWFDIEVHSMVWNLADAQGSE